MKNSLQLINFFSSTKYIQKNSLEKFDTRLTREFNMLVLLFDINPLLFVTFIVLIF